MSVRVLVASPRTRTRSAETLNCDRNSQAKLHTLQDRCHGQPHFKRNLLSCVCPIDNLSHRCMAVGYGSACCTHTYVGTLLRCLFNPSRLNQETSRPYTPEPLCHSGCVAWQRTPRHKPQITWRTQCDLGSVLESCMENCTTSIFTAFGAIFFRAWKILPWKILKQRPAGERFLYG